MKKILLLSALLCTISCQLFAQISNSAAVGKFSIGVDAGLPTGNANNFFSAAIGGDLKYSSPVAKNFSVSLSAGYTELIGKNFNYSYSDGTTSIAVGGEGINVGVVPVKVGVRYCSNGTTGFFAEGQFGAAFLNQGGGTTFAYAPAVGCVFNGGFEAGVRYEGWEKGGGTISQVALRLAFGF